QWFHGLVSGLSGRKAIHCGGVSRNCRMNPNLEWAPREDSTGGLGTGQSARVEETSSIETDRIMNSVHAGAMKAFEHFLNSEEAEFVRLGRVLDTDWPADEVFELNA